jgi:hypothetical protein
MERNRMRICPAKSSLPPPLQLGQRSTILAIAPGGKDTGDGSILILLSIVRVAKGDQLSGLMELCAEGGKNPIHWKKQDCKKAVKRSRE